MRLNEELVRQVLLAVESQNRPAKLVIDGYEDDEITYHAALLLEAGFIKGQRQINAVIPIGLTWSGHEFVEKVRDPKIWRETKSKAAKIGSFSIKTLSDIAAAVIAAKISG